VQIRSASGEPAWPDAPALREDRRTVDAARLDVIPIFASLSESDKALIAEVAEPVEVPSDQAVATQNDFGYSFFAIEDGTADVRIDDETVGKLGQGDFFGEIALLCTGRRTAAVVSTSPMTLFSIFDRDFRQIETRIPELARTLRAFAGERLAAARA
jgi:CRP-like cAMP-binding protein